MFASYVYISKVVFPGQKIPFDYKLSFNLTFGAHIESTIVKGLVIGCTHVILLCMCTHIWLIKTYVMVKTAVPLLV